MSGFFFLEDSGKPVDIGVAPVPVRDALRAEAPAPASPASTGSSGGTETIVGQGGNGRLHANLPAAAWEIAATSPSHPDGKALAIHASSDRVVLQYAGFWELFDTGLRRLIKNSIVNGSQLFLNTPTAVLALDPDRSLIYAPEGDGVPSAFDLKTGKLSFRIPFSFGHDFGKPLIWRKGSAFLSIAVELRKDPHGHHLPEMCVLEARELEEPVKILDDMTLYASSKRRAQIYYNDASVLPAMHKDSLVLVFPDAVYLLDTDLRVHAFFQAEFKPMFLSLDEAGLLHLLVESKSVARFWVLDRAGRRLLDTPLAPEWGRPIAAPVIGYDHGAILVFEKKVVSISPLGKRRWEKDFPDGMGGCSVAPDGRVLVAAGRELLAYEPDGARNVLIRVPGESLRTPPILTAKGEILVAGAKAIYKLAPKK